MDNHLYVEIDKCIFHAKEVPLLRIIVSGSGLRMDPNKAKAIVNWPWLTNKTEVQQLLGLWNIYWRFGPGYTSMVSPITDSLNGIDNDMCLEATQEAAFLEITVLFNYGKMRILRQYDLSQPALVETDASDFAIAGILSQTFEDSKLHPVRFISTKLLPAELNYDGFDKEMLAIAFSSRKWRYFLQAVEHKTIVYSDHWNLTYFKTAVSLNRTQARWAQELQPLISICFIEKVLVFSKQIRFLGAWCSPSEKGLRQPPGIKHC